MLLSLNDYGRDSQEPKRLNLVCHFGRSPQPLPQIATTVAVGTVVPPRLRAIVCLAIDNAAAGQRNRAEVAP